MLAGLVEHDAGAAEAPVLSVYSVEYPPLVMKGDAGRSSGIAVEVIAQAALLAGLGVRMPEMPWKRAQLQVQQDADSCLIPFTRPGAGKTVSLGRPGVVQPVLLHQYSSFAGVEYP